MGIVSHCPNGHRAKLKDRYAGLRIRCPACGVKYWVDRAESAAGSALIVPDAEPSVVPAVSASEAESTLLPEAIAAAPEAAWCIALPGGEPSQPLQAAAMLAWLAAGKATGKELVWRSDWSDWKPIGVIFPESLGGDQDVNNTALSVPRAAGSGTIGSDESS